MNNRDLARLCHYSVEHFIRRFRALTGQTPAQFIIDARLRRASHDLIFSRDSIESIAERTGFCDRAHFSKMFSARVGIPPAQYRNTNRP